MAYEAYTADADERVRVQRYMELFMQRRAARANHEAAWEEAAAICWPEYRNTFSYGHVRTAGAKMTEFQLDSTGAIDSHRFAAIAEVLLTPSAMLWSRVKPAGKPDDVRYLMKDRTAKQYFYDLTRVVWENRYRPEANFVAGNQRNMQGLCVFGNMGMLTMELDRAPGGLDPGLRYVSTSVGEMYPLENHQGRHDGYIRHFRWTARQAIQRWKDTCPKPIKEAAERHSQERFDFLEFVLPRSDYDPSKILSPQGKLYTSCYVSPAGMCILEEGGYRSFPWAGGRYSQAPEEIDGRGPIGMVLPELKTLNAEKGIYLEAGHLGAKPMWLLPEDGLLDFKAHPGAFIYGGLGPNGEEYAKPVHAGDHKITEDLMKLSREAVHDACLVSLYPQLFSEKGRVRSAREVIEAASDRMMFLTPLGRQFNEYIGPMSYRELDVLAWLGELPDMPPIVREAGGKFRIEACGPLARAMSSQPVAGYFRTVELAKETVQAGGSPDIMDIFEFETALPEIADLEFSPPTWMATPQRLQQKRAQRAKAAERDRQVKEMPGRAAIMKANAITAKAQTGGNTGGTLSGTPAGGMPLMPGQTEPGGREFG